MKSNCPCSSSGMFSASAEIFGCLMLVFDYIDHQSNIIVGYPLLVVLMINPTMWLAVVECCVVGCIVRSLLLVVLVINQMLLLVVGCIDNQSNVVGAPMLVVRCIDHQSNVFVDCFEDQSNVVDGCG
jgi:hypothetical protein